MVLAIVAGGSSRKARTVSNERLTYWKCPKCFGTGRVIVNDHKAVPHAKSCVDCDGSGNALVDGQANEHLRRLSEIDARNGR